MLCTSRGRGGSEPRRSRLTLYLGAPFSRTNRSTAAGVGGPFSGGRWRHGSVAGGDGGTAAPGEETPLDDGGSSAVSWSSSWTAILLSNSRLYQALDTTQRSRNVWKLLYDPSDNQLLTEHRTQQVVAT